MNFQIIFIFALMHGFAQAKLINLSCRKIRAFVNGHNSRRLQLAKGEIPGQPPASGMKFMVWDEELADKAGIWASRNKFAYNPDSTIVSRRFDTGENIYWESSTSRGSKIDIAIILKTWFDEYVDYTYGPLTNKRFGASAKYHVASYTQMAWANTMYLGCAISQYGNDETKNFLVVCNYGPSGNILGQTPYEIGNGNSSLICGTNDCSQPYGNKCRNKTIINVVPVIEKIVNGNLL